MELLEKARRRFADRPNIYGPVIRDGGYLRETCPHCGAVAIRPVDMPRAVRTYPPGHLLERDRRGRVVRDVCPELTPPD